MQICNFKQTTFDFTQWTLNTECHIVYMWHYLRLHDSILNFSFFIKKYKLNKHKLVDTSYLVSAEFTMAN